MGTAKGSTPEHTLLKSGLHKSKNLASLAAGDTNETPHPRFKAAFGAIIHSPNLLHRNQTTPHYRALLHPTLYRWRICKLHAAPLDIYAAKDP